MRTHFRRESSRMRALHGREIWRALPSMKMQVSGHSLGTVRAMWREATWQLLCFASTLVALASIPLLGLCWFAAMQNASPLAVLP